MNTSAGFLFPLLLSPLVALGQISEVRLDPSVARAEDEFGVSLSISGDRAIVGAWAYDKLGNPGSAYIFEQEGNLWVEKARLTASDARTEDGFGLSVSISGDYAIVGRHGFAYIFKLEGESWVEQVRFGLSALSRFGYSVSISDDRAVVGSYDDYNVNGAAAGAAHIFKREGTNWIEEVKLIANDGAPSDFFGRDVSISGSYILIGADGDDDNGNTSGSAYVFRREGVNWVEEAKLTPGDGAEGDLFGASVALSGDYAIVGASGDDDKGDFAGSAYIFRREGVNWVQEAKLIASDGGPDDLFGTDVSISGDHALAGANGDARYSGSAYIFTRQGTVWVEEVKLTASDGSANDNFGSAVSISGGQAVVGAPENGDHGYESGSAYVYSGFTDDLCSDYSYFLASCSEGNTVKARVVLVDNIAHSGETVLFQIDSTTYPATIVDNGISSRASISIQGLGSGSHSVSVLDPAGCFSSRVASCRVEKADHEWDNDEARCAAELECGKALSSGTTKLLGNNPNPFNPSTSIRYALSEDSHVTLRIYNMLGQVVATLVDERQTAGYKSVLWDGRNDAGVTVGSGVYIYRISAGEFVATRRMVFMK